MALGKVKRPRKPNRDDLPTDTVARMPMPNRPFRVQRPNLSNNVSDDDGVNYGQGRDFSAPTVAMPNLPPVQRPVAPVATVKLPQRPTLGNREENVDIQPISKPLRDQISERSGRDYKGKWDENHQYRDKKGWNWLDTLKGAGIAALGSLKNINPNAPIGNQLGSVLGAGIVGGIGGTINPNLDEQWKNEQELNSLYDQYGKESQIDEAERKAEAEKRKAQNDDILAKFEQAQKVQNLKKGEVETQNLQLTGEGKALENLRAVNKPLYDSITADGQITDDEAIQLADAGYNVNPYDARKFNTRYVNGVPFQSPQLGQPNFKPSPSLPIRPAEVPQNYKIGNMTLPLSPKQVAPVVVATENNNANRQQSASQFTQRQASEEENRGYQRAKDEQSRLDDWQNKVNKGRADYESAIAEIGVLTKAKEDATAQGLETASIDAKLADATGRAAAAKIAMNAKKPATVQRPTAKKSKKTKKYTGKNPAGLNLDKYM